MGRIGIMDRSQNYAFFCIYLHYISFAFHLHFICILHRPGIDIFALHFINILKCQINVKQRHGDSQNRYVALQSAFCNADTDKSWFSFLFHFWGGLPNNHMVRRVVLLLLLQQQQDELDDDGPSMQSPYDNEGRRRDRRVPRPALHHPRLSPWTQLLNSVNDQALITSYGIYFESFLTLLT